MNDDMIFRVLRGRGTLAEVSAVQKWRRESAENEVRYRQCAELLSLTAQVDAAQPRRVPPPAEHFMHRVEERSAREARKHRTQRRYTWIRRLAAAAVLVGVAFGIWEQLTDAPLDLGFGVDEFVTGVSETATVSLRDGTVVRLAPRSRLRIQNERGIRAVALEGRAYFAVAKMEGRGFRIATSAGTVTVLGTRFDLNTESDELRLVVVEGRVALAAQGQKEEVGAGEVGQVIRGKLLPAVKVPDVRPMVDWLGDFLAFQATPFGEAAREIGEEYDVRIDIREPAIARRTITAWFADQTLETVLGTLCLAVEARCVIESDTLVTVTAR